MIEIVFSFLKEFEKNGFKAYVIGGFSRDFYMGNINSDIDVCTDCKISEIKNIFSNIKNINNKYGFCIVEYMSIKFEVTTFRKENKYLDNRHPEKVVFINDLEKDLYRRDFTINTLCIDSNKNYIDILNSREDIDNKIIKTVGNSFIKFSEDALRILRCIRFATILNFQISKECKKAILRNKHLIKNISYYRKREELEKIFSNSNKKYGIKLLTELNLLEELEIYKLNDIVLTDSIGIWAQLDVFLKYPFNKKEIKKICEIKKILNNSEISNFSLYYQGIDSNMIAADILGIDRKKVLSMYNKLKIKSRKDIKISNSFIASFSNLNSSKIYKEIYKDLELNILLNKLENDYISIKKFIIKKYFNHNIK